MTAQDKLRSGGSLCPRFWVTAEFGAVRSWPRCTETVRVNKVLILSPIRWNTVCLFRSVPFGLNCPSLWSYLSRSLFLVLFSAKLCRFLCLSRCASHLSVSFSVIAKAMTSLEDRQAGEADLAVEGVDGGVGVGWS